MFYKVNNLNTKDVEVSVQNDSGNFEKMTVDVLIEKYKNQQKTIMDLYEQVDCAEEREREALENLNEVLDNQQFYKNTQSQDYLTCTVHTSTNWSDLPNHSSTHSFEFTTWHEAMNTFVQHLIGQGFYIDQEQIASWLESEDCEIVKRVEV